MLQKVLDPNIKRMRDNYNWKQVFVRVKLIFYHANLRVNLYRETFFLL